MKKTGKAEKTVEISVEELRTLAIGFAEELQNIADTLHGKGEDIMNSIMRLGKAKTTQPKRKGKKIF